MFVSLHVYIIEPVFINFVVSVGCNIRTRRGQQISREFTPTEVPTLICYTRE